TRLSGNRSVSRSACLPPPMPPIIGGTMPPIGPPTRPVAGADGAGLALAGGVKVLAGAAADTELDGPPGNPPPPPPAPPLLAGVVPRSSGPRSSKPRSSEDGMFSPPKPGMLPRLAKFGMPDSPDSGSPPPAGIIPEAPPADWP